MGLSDKAGAFGSGVVRGGTEAAKGTWEGIKALGQGTWGLISNEPGAREAFWANTKAGANAIADYGAQAYEDPDMIWRDARSTAGAAWTRSSNFVRTADSGQWGELVGGGGFVAATSALGVGIATKAVQVGSRGMRIANKARQVARADKDLPDTPARAVTPCPNAVAATKVNLKLRDDLGPEHFDLDGKLKWPLNDGFDGTPLPGQIPPGTLIDRYSAYTGKDDKGSFFAPAGTDFAERSLPYDPSKIQYAQYRVVKPIDAHVGRAAAAFEQPGGGTQFMTTLSTKELVRLGYLKQVFP